MKSTVPSSVTVALLAVLGAAGVANADVVLDFPGSHFFNGSSGQTVTTPALTGSLSGVRIVFTYQPIGGSSSAYDVAFTVNQHQWGGFLPFINGASIGECPTGVPGLAVPMTFSSHTLGIDYNVALDHQPVVVGFGNGNQGGSSNISDVTITLFGVVPTPGAAAIISLGGLCAVQRPRRA